MFRRKCCSHPGCRKRPWVHGLCEPHFRDAREAEIRADFAASTSGQLLAEVGHEWRPAFTASLHYMDEHVKKGLLARLRRERP